MVEQSVRIACKTGVGDNEFCDKWIGSVAMRGDDDASGVGICDPNFN